MIDLNIPEIKFAVHAVRQAAQVVQNVQAELVSPALTKDDRSPVTVADFASQAVIAHLLEEAFPNDTLVAEEDAAALRAPDGRATLELVNRFAAHFSKDCSPEQVCAWIDRGAAAPGQRFWVLDPIDGTKGFLRGDQYAVALALIVDGQVRLGALACPNLSDAYRPEMHGPGSLVIAGRGLGAWTTPLAEPGNFERLNVSQRNHPTEARLLRSFESGHTNIDQIDEFAQALGIQAEPLKMDSQAKYAVLAAGKGDLLLRLLSPAKPNYKEKIWDQAAGSIVVQEAGGQITDLQGVPFDFTAGRSLANNRGVLASNSLLHPAALQALRAIGA